MTMVAAASAEHEAIATLRQRLAAAEAREAAAVQVLRSLAATAASGDTQPVLDAIAERVTALCGASVTVLWLCEGEDMVPVARWAAVETSGDFYDVLALPAPWKGALEPIQIAVGDVAGKGMAAALVTALARSALHASASVPTGLATTASTLRVAGQRLHRDVGGQHFVGSALVAAGGKRQGCRRRDLGGPHGVVWGGVSSRRRNATGASGAVTARVYAVDRHGTGQPVYRGFGIYLIPKRPAAQTRRPAGTDRLR